MSKCIHSKLANNLLDYLDFANFALAYSTSLILHPDLLESSVQ